MRSRDTFHIVVTDINHNVRDFLQRELEKEGYTVASVKTGIMVLEHIASPHPLDLIILDPELFHGFDEEFIDKIVRRRPSLQIIMHTFADWAATIQPGPNIHLVEKDGQSIGAIKSIVQTCFTRFQEKSTS